jgi:AcrR family transcriptional regulator
MNSTNAKKNNFGRPRLLTHEGILEAAIELGLETVTMKRLAAHLGVGTATLYQYYDSRKSLMRAAALHSMSGLPFPEDVGQHWAEFAREFAASICSALSDNPSFITSYHASDYGFEVQFNLVEQFLSVMTSRGFETEQAMRLFNALGMAAYAGAVETVRQREFEFSDETIDIVARRQFDRLDAAEFPHMKQVMPIFTMSPDKKMDLMLNLILQTIAAERGEAAASILPQ